MKKEKEAKSPKTAPAKAQPHSLRAEGANDQLKGKAQDTVGNPKRPPEEATKK